MALCLFAIACSSAKKSSTTNHSDSELARRQIIVQTARQYLGTEYKYAGKSPKTGFDCSGFTSYVLGKFKVNLSPASNQQAKQGHEISVENVLPGDILVFGHDGQISHVALVSRREKAGIFCIHATSSRGVVEDNVTQSNYWKPKILFARDVISR